MPRNRTTRRLRHRQFRPLVERLETRLAPANVDVLSYHNDPLLNGQNLQEENLTPANVNVTNFGKLFSQAVDGPIYAQPLYKANFAIAGGTHNVVFVATENDSVYAFDADSPTAGPGGNGLYWHDLLIDPAHGITAVPPTDVGNPDIVPTIGITGTPVIDPSTNAIYFVAATKEVRGNVAHYVQYFYALDLATGANKPNSPYTLGDTVFGGPDGGFTDTTAISVPGTGDGSSGGVVRFNAARHLQRPGLQLVNGVVYVAFASHSDFRPYHGWVLGFDKTTLQPVKVFDTTPNAGGAGIWQSGGAVSADPQGNLFIAIGNGFNGPNLAFDPAHNDYSEAVLKLSTTGQLSVADYFVPFDWQALDNQDADLGSGGVMLLPDYVGSATHLHLAVETGKSGKIYLIDRDNMGQNVPPPGPDRVVQTIQNQPGVWGNPAFYRTGPASGIIYYHGSGADLRGYPITNGQIDVAHVLHSTVVSGFPGTQPVVSANGIANPTSPTNGIAWDFQVDNFGGGGIGLGGNPTTAAILRAWNATSFNSAADELYDTLQASPRDQLGTAAKFTTVAVSNGHVFVPTQTELDVLGLFPASTAVPAARTDLQGTLAAGPHIDLSWTNPAPAMGAAPTGIRILRSTDGTNFTQVAIVAGTVSSYRDNGPFVIGQTYFYRVIATNQRGDAPPSNTAMVTIPIASAGLTLAGVSSSSIGLSWTAVANDHYTIERSTNGTTFTAVATVPAFLTTYTDTGLTPGTYAYRVHAFNTNPNAESLSNVTGATVGATIDHANGFANATDLTANGNAAFPADTTLRLTTADAQTGSAFSNTRMTVARFTTTFQIRLHEGTQPNYADGLTFVLQANAPTALGQGGSGLGYQGIGRSVAVKFGTFQYPGDPSNSTTGLVTNGAAPRGGVSTLPDVLLNSQDQKDVTLIYDGTTLTESIVDVPRSTMFTTSFAVDIPGILSSDTAYVGFTAATGSPGTQSYWELQDVVNWQFTSQAPLPGAPANLRATSFTSNEIDLAWNANSYNETRFSIERSVDGTNFTAIDTTTATTYKDVGLRGGTYYYRVRAANAAGNSPYSNTLQTGLPGPILTQDQDVGTPGDPALPGSASFANGVYTVRGSGHDIWDQADGFHFVYKPLLGDGMIQARVVAMSTIQQTDYWAKAGVMIRESLNANSRDVYVTMTPHNQVQFLDRTDTGANANDVGDATNTPFPIWVRVVRQGNTFTGFYSTNGTTWVQLGGPVVISMASATYVGLVVSSHTNGAINTAMFDNVTVVPAVLQPSHLDVSPNVFVANPGTPVTVTVRALEPFNNTAPGYRGTIHFTTSDGSGTLPADYTFTAADAGVHTFSVVLWTLGRQTLFATDTVNNYLMGGTAVLVTDQAVLSSLVVAGFPSPVAAGVAGSFTVTARDAGGNVFTGYRGTVHFTSTDPAAQLPADYTFTATDSGVHTFMATFNTPGTQALTAIDAAAGVSGMQAGILVVSPPSITTVSRSAAVIFVNGTLTVGGSFTDPVAGQTHQVVLNWGDGSANTTLSLPVGTSTFTAPHVYTQAGNFEVRVTVVAANGGNDTVILTATAAAAPPPTGLVGWWTGDGTNPATAPDLGGANPGTLVNGAAHAPGEVGNAFSFNGNGQYVNLPTGTNIPVGNPTYTLLAWIRPNAAGDEGIIGYGNYGVSNQTNAFRLLDDGTGHLNFRHYWWDNDLDAHTNLPAAGAWHLAVAEFDGTTRRIILDGQVIAQDTPAGHNVPSAANFRIGSTNNGEFFNGLIDEAQVYNRALTLAEVQAIFGAGAAGLIKGVRVQDLTLHYAVTGFPSPVTAGTAGNVTVAVLDQFGNPVPGYRGTVHFTSSDPQATLPGDYTFTAADMGVHTFSATLKTAGSQSLTATDTASGSITGTQSGIMVTAAALSQLVVTGFPSPMAAGRLGDFFVSAADAYGNLVPGYRGTVHFSSSDGRALLPADYTFTAADSGRAHFNAALVQAGTQSLTATDVGNPAVTGTQGGIVVTAAAADHFALTAPATTTAGEPLDVTLTALDPYGNVATGFQGTVHFGSSDPQADVPPDYTFTPADMGTHTFSFTLRTAGNQTISGGNASATVTVNAAAAAFFLIQPPDCACATAGQPFAVIVSARDPYGNIDTQYTGTVTFSSSDPLAGLPADYTFTPGDGGVAALVVTLYTAGDQSLTATDTNDPTITGSTTATVAAAAAASFFLDAPSQVAAGDPFTVTVYALDPYGNIASGYLGTVHFDSTDAAAELPPDYTFQPGDGGVASFDIALNTPGDQTLTVTDTSDPSITGSAAITVTDSGASGKGGRFGADPFRALAAIHWPAAVRSPAESTPVARQSPHSQGVRRPAADLGNDEEAFRIGGDGSEIARATALEVLGLALGDLDSAWIDSAFGLTPK